MPTVAPVALYFHRLSQAGGAERMICEMANALSGHGINVHIMSLDSSGAQSFYPIGSSVTWHRLGSSAGVLGKLRRVQQMATIMHRHGVRVLIGFVMSGDKTVYTASRVAGVRLVAAERNGPSIYRIRYARWQRWLTFALLHLCDAITVQFPEYIQGYPKSLRKHITCIANPVGAARSAARPELPGSDGRFHLLAVGRLDAIQKRFDCLIKAFSCVSHSRPEWDLEIIGEGEHEPDLRKLAADLGLTDRVTFHAPTAQIHDAYANAHLFVMPSRWEGFSNALAEALSSGLPAVGFRDAEGVAQLIADGSSGWLAGPGDETLALANALNQAMSNGDERRRRGMIAAQKMRKYEPEKQYRIWATLIERIASERIL